MESLYKKKNLKFSGCHKELKKGEIQKTREASRQKRLSTLRDISFRDSKENVNEIHKLGEKKTGIPSRNDMLKRWKEEKTVKQKQKELNMKPISKPGFCFQRQTSKALDSKNKTDDSKLNVRNLSNIAQRTGFQNTKIASTVLKSASQPTKPLCMPKKPTALVTKSSLTNIKSQVSQRSVLVPKSSVSKLGPTSLSLKTSALQGKTIVKETKPIIQKFPNPTRVFSQPSKVAPPLTNTRIASKNVSSLPKVTQKLPLAKSKLEKDIKSNASSSNKQNKVVFPKHISHPSSKPLSKRNQTTKDQSTNAAVMESKVETGEIFNCDLSMIEPNISRKSFAPHNFLFCPPSEWSFPFQIDISSPASFLKLRSNGVQRTSSPLKLEEIRKSSDNELSTATIKEDPTLNHSLHKGTSFEEKMKISPDDSGIRLSNTNAQDLNMKGHISEMEKKGITSTENCNIFFSGITTNLSPKMPFTIPNDKNTEDIKELQEKGVLSLPQNVEPTLRVALDNSTPQITSKDCSSFCITNLSETLEQDKSLEAVKCVTSKALEDSKLIIFESVDAVSSYEPINKSASQNISQMLVPIDNPSQNTAENCSDLCIPSSSKNSEQDKLFETVKCATPEIMEDNKLVNIDSVDVIFSFKPIENIAPENNREESAMPIYKNADCSYLRVTSSGQNSDQKTLETVDCLSPKMLEDNNEVKAVGAMSSYSALENGLNGLIEVENHVDACPSSLSESLKSFNLATSVSERVSEKISMRHRKSKMPQRYTLESINESIESKGTPCVTPKSLKELVAEETFTPRRSARLSEKLNRSGSFESILNIEKPEVMNFLDLDDIKLKTGAPKNIADGTNRTPVSSKKKSKRDENFTPRRSQRLSEMLRRSSSFEDLFEVRRPSVMGSPCKGDFPVGNAAGITYDFDNLVLEDSPKVIKAVKGRAAQFSKKVSLLYTPPARKSTLRQSIRGDLMSFSPS